MDTGAQGHKSTREQECEVWGYESFKAYGQEHESTGHKSKRV